ncbi:hypothetical protein D3C84_642740 [compost metagenome]
MRFADHGAEAVFRIQWVPHFPIAQMLADQLQQLILDVFMNNQPRGGRAVLAHVPESASRHILGNLFQIFAVIHHHGGVFTPQFQHHALEVRLGRVLEE